MGSEAGAPLQSRVPRHTAPQPFPSFFFLHPVGIVSATPTSLTPKKHAHKGANGRISLFRSIDMLQCAGACRQCPSRSSGLWLPSLPPAGIECWFALVLGASETCHCTVALIYDFQNMQLPGYNGPTAEVHGRLWEKGSREHTPELGSGEDKMQPLHYLLCTAGSHTTYRHVHTQNP